MRGKLTIGFVLALGLGGPALAQLSREDVSALQKRAEVERWTFTVGENEATRRPLHELCGLVEPPNWRLEGRFDPCTPKRALPPAFTWCEQGGCTAVKHQGNCGSCWAFATVGPLECNILIKDGVEVDLSEQWLVSCNQEGWSCSGGWFVHDYHQWKTDPFGDTGAVLDLDFPYVARDDPCDGPYPHPYKIEEWFYIGPKYGVPTVDAIKQAIIDYGPVSVAVRAVDNFVAYTGGVFNLSSPGSVNHAVVLVGWDDTQGANGVWILRNSWGTSWGEHWDGAPGGGGYMRIEYDCSSVGYRGCYVDYPGDGDPRKYLVVILDRTGSMNRETASNRTRCELAYEFAYDDLTEWFAEFPNGLASVWIFNTRSDPEWVYNATGGFVGEDEALDAFNTPKAQVCRSATPLAETVCTAIVSFPLPHGQRPEDKFLKVYTDGFENSSRDECDGPMAAAGTCCAETEDCTNPFSPESWQAKVCAKIDEVGIGHRNIVFFDDFIQGARIDAETGREVTGVYDEVFFAAIATHYEPRPDDSSGVPPPSGACCMPNGACLDGVVEDTCQHPNVGGTYLGHDTTCTGVECPRACCLPDGTCVALTPTDCTDQSGTSQAVGETCTTLRACCLPDDTCVDLDPLCCEEQGGTPRPPGTSCTETKACCLPDDTCEVMDPECCLEQGGFPNDGAPVCLDDGNVNGHDDACEHPRACCLGDGTCVIETPDDCDAADGTLREPASTCGPLEACCFAGGGCVMTDRECCLLQGGSPQAFSSQCALATEACCMPDGSCTTADPICCTHDGGTPTGEGTACTAVAACCFLNGDCEMLDPLCCEEQGGVAHGGEICSGLIQVCCFNDGRCEDLDPLCCADQGGVPLLPDMSCTAPEACQGPANGQCEEIDPECCDLRDWEPQGPGTTCPPGACCLPDGDCNDLSPDGCTAQDGSTLGAGSSCTGVLQACCLSDGCSDMEPQCCTDRGGAPQGADTSCTVEETCCSPGGDCVLADPLCFDERGCEVPLSCCLPYGACQEAMLPSYCESIGGTSKPIGTCDMKQACCLPNGMCLDSAPDCCVNGGGESQGTGTTCDPTGACCFTGGACMETTLVCCKNGGGSYRGDGSHCLGDGNGDGIDDGCADIPAVSEWGLLVMALLVLVAGTIVIRGHTAAHGV